MTVPLTSCLATDRGSYGNWLSTAGQSKTEHASNGLVNAGARTGARNLFRRNRRSGVLLRNKFRAPLAFTEALRMCGMFRVAMLALLLWPLGAAAQSSPYTLYQHKALYLFNFAKYT